MPIITLQLPENLDPTTARVLRNILAQLDGILSREHNADGTHGAITARSINLEPNAFLDEDEDVLSLYGVDHVSIIGMTGASHETIYTEWKSTVRVESIIGSPPAVYFFRPTATSGPVHGEMFLLVNSSTQYFVLIHGAGQYGMLLPQNAHYYFAPNVSMQFRYDGISAAWRPFMVGGTQLVGDIFLRLGSCPPGSTEVTSLQNKFLQVGTVAEAGTTGGSATHAHSLSILSTANGAHTPAGSVSTPSGSVSTPTGSVSTPTGSISSVGDHSHTFSVNTSTDGAHVHYGSTDYNGDHSHTYNGTTDTGGSAHSHYVEGGVSGTTAHENNGSMNVDAGGSGTMARSSHGHDFSAGFGTTTDEAGSHTHGYSGDTNSTGGHTHGFTADSNGNHYHSASGSTSDAGGHGHTFTGNAATFTGNAVTFTGNPAVFSGTAVPDHQHGVAGNTDASSSLPPWTKVVLCMRN